MSKASCAHAHQDDTPSRTFEKVCQILDCHGRRSARLIPILQEIQREYRYLPEPVLTYVATSLGIPPARVYGVATFYSFFTLKPKGKHVVHLCDGTACHVSHSLHILDALRKRLGLPEGKETTEDMLFTVETVACLGACGLSPVMVVDGKVHGSLTPETAVEVIEKILAEEEAQ